MRTHRNISRTPAKLRTITIALALVIGMHGLAPSSYGNPDIMIA